MEHTLGMILPFVLAGLLIQATAAHQSAADAADSIDARFVLDMHDKKIDDVLTLYAKDAVFLQPDGTEVSGAGLRALYEQVFKAFDSDLHLKRTGLKHDLNTVIEDGTYTETLGHRDTGKLDNVMGTYRFTLHLDPDGQWRYSRMEWH
jgi:ketosteroid isomerase-like protein